MGRDGEWGQLEVMVGGVFEPSLLCLGWNFKVVEPPDLNPGMVKVRMWHTELVEMLWSKRLS